MRSRTSRAALAGLVMACVVSLAACSGGSGGESTASASGGTIKIDVGTTTLTFPAGTKPEIAMFAGSGIAYQTAYQNEIPKLEKKYGVNITYFDSKFDPTTQLNQIRQAIQSKKYNSFMVENYSAEAACQLLSKDAPVANIVVSQLDNPTCDQATKPAGDSFWTPGTLNTINPVANVTYQTSFIREAKKMMGPGDHVYGALLGPPLVANTSNYEAALAANDIKPVSTLNGDYSTPTALKLAADMFQANPDIDAVFTPGADNVLGIVQALKQAGKKPGDVKIFTISGSKTMGPLIQEGWVTAAAPDTPITLINTAVEQLVNAFDGKQGPRYLDALNKGTAEDPFMITKDTLSEYTFEY